MFGPTLLIIASLTGCRGVDPAPEDLDGLIHFFWQNAEAEDPDVLAGAFETLNETEGDALEDVIDGNVSRLSEEEAAMVPAVDADPEAAAGIFMLNTFACTAEELEPILVYLEQDRIREGTYDDYERVYTSDFEAWDADATEWLTWDTSIAAEVVFSSYTSELSADIRQIETELGPAYASRAWFTEPAEFDGNNTWTQDFQLELFYERAPGEIVHLYAMWRELDVAGFSSENSGVQRQVLNGLKDWDDETEAICAEGLP